MEEKTVALRIRKEREKRAWTQQHLAEAAGVSERTVQRAEEGTVSAETLTAIAGALDVAVTTLTRTDEWPRITPALFYDDAQAAIDFLVRAFGFEVRLKVAGPGGKIMHSELTFEDGVIMVGTANEIYRSPKQAGGCTQGLSVLVEDVDAHFARAKEAGARIVGDPAEAHGYRRYFVMDPEGHHWSFMQRVS